MGLGRIIDAAIAVPFPGWAAARADARLKFAQRTIRETMMATFSAAERKRGSNDWPSKSTAAEAIITADMSTINNRARAAVRDSWLARSIVDGFVRHAVGIGTTPKFGSRDPESGEPDADFNRAATRAFTAWSRRPALCDLERRKNFVALQSLGIRELITVGQSFLTHNIVGNPAMPETLRYAFGVLEVEQLDTRQVRNADSGYLIRNGIEVDDNGAAVRYWFYKDGHPYDSLTPTQAAANRWSSVSFAADRVGHLMLQERPRQSHGLSRLACILRKLWDLDTYDLYSMMTAKGQACFLAAVTMGDDRTIDEFAAQLPSGETGRDVNNNRELSFQPGQVWQLRQGEDVKFHSPQVPNGTYDPFTKAQATRIAAGAGSDYPTAARDFTGATFSGQRQAMLERNAEIDPIQGLLIDTWLSPVVEQWLQVEIMSGRLTPPERYWSDPAGTIAQIIDDLAWQVPPRPWIDPANQAAAAKIALEMRLDSREGLINETGRNRDDVFAQIAEDQEQAAELGIGLPDAPQAGTVETKTNPREARPRPTSEPAKPDNDDDADEGDDLEQIRGRRLAGHNGNGDGHA